MNKAAVSSAVKGGKHDNNNGDDKSAVSAPLRRGLSKEVIGAKYEELAAKGVNYCRNQGASDEEDIVHTLFLRLLQGAPFSEDKFDQFVFCRLRDRCKDDYRHQKVIKRNEEPLAVHLEELLSNRGVDEDLKRIVGQAMDQLTDKLREAVTLHYWEGFDIREIAQRLGVGEGAIKSRLSRAYEQLLEWLSANEWRWDELRQLMRG